jgi:DNA-3-methyladenine glycosylase II
MAQRVETQADVSEGVAWLVKAAPGFAAEVKRIGGPGRVPLRRDPVGFASLASIVIGQQLSTASAQSIKARCAAAGLMEADGVRGATDEALRACGLSRQKARTLRGLAESGVAESGAAMSGATTDAVVEALTAVPGIGRWTAEVYALRALGHADAFPAADLALRVSAARVMGWPDRPSEGAMRREAGAWSPWRAVAARILWAGYRV